MAVEVTWQMHLRTEFWWVHMETYVQTEQAHWHHTHTEEGHQGSQDTGEYSFEEKTGDFQPSEKKDQGILSDVLLHNCKLRRGGVEQSRMLFRRVKRNDEMEHTYKIL